MGSVLATSSTGKNDSIVVSALKARANFGKLLNRVDNERRLIRSDVGQEPGIGVGKLRGQEDVIAYRV